jgi:hypothetical protein
MRRSSVVWQMKRSLITQSWCLGHDITPSLMSLGVKDVDIRWAGVEAPPGVLAWDAAWLVNLAGIMGGVAEVGAVAPPVTVLTFGERFAIFNIVVIGVAPCTVEGVMVGAIGPRVIEVVVGVVDLVVSYMSEGGHAVDDPRGNVVVGVGISKCLDTFEVLFCDIF